MTDKNVIDGSEITLSLHRIDISVVAITPATARRWLERNVKNRPIRQSKIAAYKADMESGRWQMAGDPIRFDVHGNLLDGQHRLTVVAELEDFTLVNVVIRGLTPESQSVMDQGAKRTPGDQLSLRGIKNAQRVAAAVRQFIIWQDGMLFRDNRVQARITSPEIESWVSKNADLVQMLGALDTVTIQNDAPPSVAGAAALAFLIINPAEAQEFFTLLARGAGTAGHPIVTLDKRLQRHRREGIKITNRDCLALFFLAWNAWRDGKQMTKFQRPKGGAWSEENFPFPH